MNCVDKRKARQQFPWIDHARTSTTAPTSTRRWPWSRSASGAVVEYVRSMGADPIFINEMSKAGPNTINALTEDQLNAYRINFTIRTENVVVRDRRAGTVLPAVPAGRRMEGRPRRALLQPHQRAAAVTSGWCTIRGAVTGREDARRIVDLASKGLSVVWQLDAPRQDGFADIRNVALQPFEIIEQPKVTEHDNVTLSIDVSQRFLDVLTGATRFQVVTTEPDAKGAGFTLISLNLDRDKVAGIVRSCR